MEPEATLFLFNLLGWVIFLVCVLFGVANATPAGVFRALWTCLSVYFGVRLADRLAIWAASLLSEPLGTEGVQSEVIGYWTVILAVVVIGAIWQKLLGDERIVVPPIVEQIGTPLLGALTGLLLGIAVFQTLFVGKWASERMPGPSEPARRWMNSLGQSWFPAERRPPESEAEQTSSPAPAAPASKPSQKQGGLTPASKQFVDPTTPNRP